MSGFSTACGGSTPAPTAAPVASVSASPAASSSAAPQPVEPKPGPAHVALPSEGNDLRLKGSRVQVWLPSGMQRPTRLPAFRLREPLMAVSFAEFTLEPAGSEKFLSGAEEGAELTDSHPYTKGKLHGFVGHTKIEDPGMRQQVLGIANGNAAAIVTVQYAEVAEPLAAKILDSVLLFEDDALDALALSGISVGDKANLEVSNRVSTPILFTEPGVKPPLNGAAALVILSVPYPKPNLTDQELGEMLGGSVGRYAPNMEKAKEEELKVGSCPAYSLTAPGLDQGKPILLYGLIARCPDSALLVTGTLRSGDEKKLLPRFQKVVRSLTLDDSIFAPLAANPQPAAAQPQPTSQKLP